ncbi:transposase [Desulfobulbus oligotrophicus]
MSEKRNRQRFTKEFKEDAVRLVLEQGYRGWSRKIGQAVQWKICYP